MSEQRKTPNGDLIMVSHAVAGIAALATALFLGWFVDPALFVVNVSVSMLSVMALAFNWTAPLPKGVSEDDFDGTRYRTLLSLKAESEQKTLTAARWGTTGLFAAFALTTAVWWGGNDPELEGTALAFLISGVWALFFTYDLKNHAEYNQLDRMERLEMSSVESAQDAFS